MISREDVELFRYVDDPTAALRLLQAGVGADSPAAPPDFAGSRCDFT